VGGTHVDDFLCSGYGPVFEKALAKLKTKLPWGSWKVDNFTDCGRQISRDGYDVVVSQDVYTQNISEITLDSRKIDRKISGAEMAAARGALGGLGWVSKQMRVDAAFDTSVLLSELPKQKPETLKAINKAIQSLKSRNMTLRFPAALDFRNCTVGTFSDASWGNRSDGSSQGGFLHVLFGGDVVSGDEVPMAPLQWGSHRIKRVCRSTLSAESQAATTAVESGDWVKVVLSELRDGQFKLSRYHEALQNIPGLLLIDAKSVYDYVTRDSGRLPSDKRLAIDLRVLQYYLEASSWGIKWISGPQMLSDVLTKAAADPTYLAWCLNNAKYQVMKDVELDIRVKETLNQWRQQTVDNTLEELTTGEAPEVAEATEGSAPPTSEKRKERNRRKSLKHQKRMAVLSKLTQEGSREEHSMAFFQKGSVKGLLLGLGALACATVGATAQQTIVHEQGGGK
jgi:hypothetical protein